MKKKIYMTCAALCALLLVGMLAETSAQNEPAWRRVANKIAGEETAAGEAVEAVMEPTTNEGEDGMGDSFEPTMSGTSADSFSMLAGESTLDLGSELDEPQGISDIFQNEDYRRMLGENPTFVYSAHDKPDPMVFPPMRRAAIAKHLFAEIDLLFKEAKITRTGVGDPETAKRVFPLIDEIRALGDERYIAMADKKETELNDALNISKPAEKGPDAGPGPDITTAEDPVLPDWIRSNTKALVALSSNPVCLVGDEAVRLGEQVPKYEHVVVVSIEDTKVVFEVSNASKSKRFDVTLEPYESAGFWR